MNNIREVSESAGLVDLSHSEFLQGIATVYQEARSHDDGELCCVAPDPNLNERINNEIAAAKQRLGDQFGGLKVKISEPKRDGFNDGMIIPPEQFPIGTAPSVIRNAALNRAPLTGTLKVIVVLVDFNDKPMTKSASHFNDLFFSLGTIATKSVREYYREVTNNIVDIQGQVVGPFRMPQNLATYAHGASGIGSALPNSRTMAVDALNAANPTVNFATYDNDGNGFVDAFIVIHAGSGAEQTGSTGDIWSHKWTLPSGAVTADGTQIFAYLTVPEDCRIGVCAHEIGHLLFGFPDLYDTDGSSEGIGNFCLMAGGSWGGAIAGDTPTHPSAWCKANQNWASVINVTSNGPKTFADVKTSNTVYRLWKDGAAGQEYFLVENRQKTAFDSFLPGPGLLIWHIDETVGSNTNEAHYKVALIQADNLKNLENKNNRGDAGDPYPGSTNNTNFSDTSSPNSKSYAGAKTCVSITGISASGPVMNANVTVKCLSKLKKEIVKELKKEIIKETKEFKKDFKEIKEFKKDFIQDKPIKEFDKPVKEFEKRNEGKLSDRPQGGLASGQSESGEERIANLEAIVAVLANSLGNTESFISQDLRPDLSQGALMEEEDQSTTDEAVGAVPKRLMDNKSTDQ